MGNTCRVPTAEAECHRHFHGEDCFISQQSACCAPNDDCLDSYDNHRYEAEYPYPDALNEKAFCIKGLGHEKCPMPHTSASAHLMGSVQRSHRPVRSRTAAHRKHCVIRECNKRPSTPIVEGKPAAAVFARVDELDRADQACFFEASGAKSRRTLRKFSVWPEATTPRRAEMVYVNLYDLSEAFAQLNSVSIDLIGFGGALHVGVEVFGVEWSFGTGGVSCTAPKQHRHFSYRQTVEMGAIDMQQRDVELAISQMRSEWSGSEYDLFSKNCGTFGNALCIRLGLGPLPAWITRLAEAAGKTPVRRITDMLVRTGVIGDGSPPCSESPPSLCGEYCATPRSHDITECDSPARPLALMLDGETQAVEGWLDEELNLDHSCITPMVFRNSSVPLRMGSSDSGGQQPLCFVNYGRPVRGISLESSQSDLPSPPRGSQPPQRCATFRGNARPQVNSAQRPLLFSESIDIEKAFVAKRLAVSGGSGYRSHSQLMRMAAGGGG